MVAETSFTDLNLLKIGVKMFLSGETTQSIRENSEPEFFDHRSIM